MGKSPASTDPRDLPIVFTQHALDRMAERIGHEHEWPAVRIAPAPISEAEVRNVIRTGRDFYRGECLYFVKGRLTAVTVPRGDRLMVLTVLDSI